MNPNLFKAILAMDSYNRGYGADIDFRLKDAKGDPISNSDTVYTISSVKYYARIGNASVYDAKGDAEAVAIGFYGIAYQLASGEKVISYRGTDELAGDGEVGSDAWYGYGVGTWTAEGKQAELAFKFYQSVAGAIDPRLANISLTGHSLGGGLAGLVGSVYIRPTSMFDNMTFETAAQSAYIFSDSKLYDYNPDLKALVYGARDRWAPYVSSLPSSILQTYHMDGEFLGVNRALQTSPQTSYSLGVGVDLPGVDSGVMGGGLHSVATLVIRMYADEKDAAGSLKIAQDWKAAAKYFWPVIYDGNFARDIGMSTVGGKLATDALSDASKVGNYAGILRNIIAYSAIDEGAFVFGNTGIRAFYNDANDLGKAVAFPGGSSVLAAKASDISKAFIQFAGQLALNKVALTTALTPVLDGVLTYTNVTNNHSLSVDFTSPVWARSGPAAIYPAYTLINSLIGSAATAPTTRAVMKTLWGDDTSAAFDRVVFAVRDSGNLVVSGTPAAGKAFLLVGGNGADTLQGTEGRDLFLGTGGNDTLYGQGGNDIFISGSGSDVLYGGTGYDAVIYRGEISGLTISGNRVTKDSGTDTLNNVEYVVLSSLNDTVTNPNTVYASSARIDAGPGYDTFTGSAAAYDMMRGKIYSNNFNTELILENFEKLNIFTRHLAPNQNENISFVPGTGIVSSKHTISGVTQMRDMTLDYSGATMKADFFLSWNGPDYRVKINGYTHQYGISDLSTSWDQVGKVIGTNYGDTVYVKARQDLYDPLLTPTMSFYSGKGNDIVFLAGSAKGLNYYYTGGNDTIHDSFGVSRVTLDPSIALSDVTVSYDAGASKLVLTVKDHGTMTFLDFVNGFRAIYSGSWFAYLDMIPHTFDYPYGGPPKGNYQNGGLAGDSLVGRTGLSEYINGGAGNDILDGRDQDDNLYGAVGDDTLIGGTGNDTLSGGFGNDIYIYNLGDGSDVIGEGNEYGEDKIILGAGILRSQVTFFSSDNPSPFGQFYIRVGATGKIEIQGGGVEKLVFADGSTIDLTKGLPFTGTNLDENIKGTDYNDTLTGLQGNDRLYGGAGDDVYFFNLGDSSSHILMFPICDQIVDSSGVDTIEFGIGISRSSVWFERTYFGDIFVHYSPTDVLSISRAIDASDVYTSKIEKIKFSDGSIMDISSGVPLSGTAGDDYVYGTVSSETLSGLSGNDHLYGKDGTDTLIGGDGNDYMDGGLGVDTASYAGTSAGVTVSLLTTAAQNTVGAGTDTLAGIENLVGSSYNDTLTGDANANTIEGGLGNDTLNGGAGVDTVSYSKATAGVTVDLSLATSQNTVGAGSDLLSNFENILGSAFADTLKGNSGANVINGGSGNDVLLGKGGNDTLYGGLGADSFKFDISAVGNIDTVKDFKLAEADKLDIRDLLVGYDPLTKAITDFVECTTSGANTIVKVDRDGAGATYGWQQIAVLENVTGLTDEATLKANGTLIV